MNSGITSDYYRTGIYTESFKDKIEIIRIRCQDARPCVSANITL